MNRKKIVILKYSFDVLGGTEIVAIKLAKELSHYHDVHMVSISTSIRDNVQGIDGIPFYNIFEQKVRGRNAILSGTKKLRKYLLDNSIDMIFSIGVHSNVIMLLSALFTRVKTINCDHTTIQNDYGNKFYALQRFLGAKFADKSIVLTEENKKGYLDKYKISNHKVDCIYNWIGSIEDKYSFDIENNRILTVGRFSKEKGYDLLKVIAKKIYDKYPGWVWDIYGDGCEDIKKELINLPNVCLKGIVRGVENIFPNHSIYVMTSYYEGLPLVLLEAKQFKLPIVSFRCPTGPSEIVRDGTNGFLVDCYDADLMFEKISVLIENVELRKRFSDSAILDCDKFSKDKIVKLWLNLINDLS